MDLRVKTARLLALGPAVIVSVAYIDPGNFGSNIAAGSTFGLRLLWIVWLSGLMAILFQYISGKLGLVGVTVPEYVFNKLSGVKFSKLWKTLYFLALFIMVLATDMAEFLGIALGFHLLLGIPLFTAVWISIIDVLILMIYANTMTRLERIIASLVAIVGLSYIYELYVVNIDPSEIIANSFKVNLGSRQEVLIATSIIGATVMPHAVLLHSYLARDKWRVDIGRVKSFLKKHAVETVLFLAVASLINASLQIMSYYAFYRNGYINIDSMELAYQTLVPLYGDLAAVVFGVAIMASGVSSSMVSVLSGVSIIESYFGRRLDEWKVRLIARLINMIPLAVAVHMGLKTIDVLVYSQAVLSMTLPLVLIPLIIISSNKRIMNDLVNSKIITALAVLSTLTIISVNAYLPFSD
ncbi:MAG: Nramp family divalent metal transporter [Desulfurococcales archaeon]|nr:Nramp family divalent metal transporter [Desulfurococcales archaeon]